MRRGALRILPSLPRGGDAPGQASAPRPGPLRLQPEPVAVRVVRLRSGGVAFTAILREWDPDEIAGCTLCPECSSPDGRTCLIAIDRDIPPADAPMLDIGAFVRDAGPGPGGGRP